MEIVFVIAPFVVAGIAVLFVAFAGGAGAAREMYLTRGGKLFTFTILILYVALGVIVPAAVIASRGESEGGVGRAARRAAVRRPTSAARRSSSRTARAATRSPPCRPPA